MGGSLDVSQTFGSSHPFLPAPTGSKQLPWLPVLRSFQLEMPEMKPGAFGRQSSNPEFLPSSGCIKSDARWGERAGLCCVQNMKKVRDATFLGSVGRKGN